MGTTKGRRVIVGLVVVVALAVTTGCVNDEVNLRGTVREYDQNESYGWFSTSPDVILIRVRSPAHEETKIVIDDNSWWRLKCREDNRDYDREEYREYMIENKGKVIDVRDSVFTELCKSNEAVIIDVHRGLMKKSEAAMVSEYMEKRKEIVENGKTVDLYRVWFTFDLHLNTRERNSFARVLLEKGLRVERCSFNSDWVGTAEVVRSH